MNLDILSPKSQKEDSIEKDKESSKS